MRLRANKHLSSLGEFVTDWRKGKFTREHTSKRLLLLDICYVGICVSTLNFSLAYLAAVSFPFPARDRTSERKSGRAKKVGRIGKLLIFRTRSQFHSLSVGFGNRVLRKVISLSLKVTP